MEVDLGAMIRDNRQINIRLELWATRAMAQVGLTAVQAHILLYILAHADRGVTLTAICREFGGSMAALSGLLKRLRAKGYVRTEPCAGDDRQKLLFGTEKGEAVKDYLEGTILQVQQRLYKRFTPEELLTLDRFQHRMLDNLALDGEEEHKEVVAL